MIPRILFAGGCESGSIFVIEVDSEVENSIITVRAKFEIYRWMLQGCREEREWMWLRVKRQARSACTDEISTQLITCSLCLRRTPMLSETVFNVHDDRRRPTPSAKIGKGGPLQQVRLYPPLLCLVSKAIVPPDPSL
ncbi:hypothetical protein K474DRAFT_1676655, partial [Panus rudis PR-1116 ss-1]